MTLTVFTAVLAAALMHAVWNAMVKVKLDRFVSITAMSVGTGIVALPVMPFVDFPAAHVWPWLAASVLCHMGYKLFLIRAYGLGDLAQTYPLARGTAPLLTTIGGVFVVAEIPGALTLTGIALLCLGTLLMSMRGHAVLQGLNHRAVAYALITSVFIAGYTLSDGSGARVAATASSYAVWLFICDAVWSFVLYVAMRGGPAVPALGAAWKLCLTTGALSGAAYWIAMWAMTKATIAAVAALRETSILFAMLISVTALGEKMTAWRAAAALAIVGGVIALRLS